MFGGRQSGWDRLGSLGQPDLFITVMVTVNESSDSTAFVLVSKTEEMTLRSQYS